MMQKGEHNWETAIQYHQCPKCQRIIESREDYSFENGKWMKEVVCPFCHNHFSLERKGRSKPSTWFDGGDQPSSLDWD